MQQEELAVSQRSREHSREDKSSVAVCGEHSWFHGADRVSGVICLAQVGSVEDGVQQRRGGADKRTQTEMKQWSCTNIG